MDLGTLTVLVIFGHILGDYFFQPKKMAINKTSDWMTCFEHCNIYTALMLGSVFLSSGSVGLTPALTGGGIPLLLAGFIIFSSHFLIDYYSLGQKWLNLIKGRNLLNDIMEHEGMPEVQAIFAAFGAIVYVVVDNTLHIAIAVIVLKIFIF